MKKTFFISSLLLLFMLVVPFNVKADVIMRYSEISNETATALPGDKINFVISEVADLTGGTITFDENILEFESVYANDYSIGIGAELKQGSCEVTSNKNGKIVIKLIDNLSTAGITFKVKETAKSENSSIKFEVFDKEKKNDGITKNEMISKFKVVKEQFPNDNEKEETTEKNNMFFYISLGANAVLLSGIIILALKKKN